MRADAVMIPLSFNHEGTHMRKRPKGMRHPRELLDSIPGEGADAPLRPSHSLFLDSIREERGQNVDGDDLDGPAARRYYNRPIEDDKSR